MKGLRLKPTYEDLINVAVSDKLYNIKFPNRNASFLRNGFVLSQLDGEGARQMERQQEMASKEAYKEHLLKEIAKNTGANFHDLRNDNHDDLRRERVNNAVYFDISQGDVDMESLYSLPVSMSDISSENLGAQTFDTGVQATTSTNEMPTQTPYVKKKEKGSQAVEDRTSEIERIQRNAEEEQEEMRRQHARNVERLVQDLKEELTEEYKQKFAEREKELTQDKDMSLREAKRIVQETEAQARQQARHMTSWAEQKSQEEKRLKEEALKEKLLKEEARKNAADSQRKATTLENKERNKEYKIERELSPDNRPKPKAKSGPSPKRAAKAKATPPPPMPPTPPIPTGASVPSSSSQEPPPESTHENKGKVGRPKNTKDQAITYDDNDSLKYWMKQNVGYIRVQAFKIIHINILIIIIMILLIIIR
jgi:chemotaxis protein histidine kinase CheA